MPRAEREQFAGIDIVRFGAAFLVMAYHLVAAKIVDGAPLYPELLGSTWEGFIGVEIFFVISGFVIAYSASESSPLRFIKSRVLRLYPTAWVCATITIFAMLPFHIRDMHALLHGYIGSMALDVYPPWIDSVYWTLGIEMAFYGCICVLLAGVRAPLMLACYILGGLSAGYWLIVGIAMPVFVNAHLWDRTFELTLVNYGIYFALGILFYNWRTRGVSVFTFAFGCLLIVAAAEEIHFKAVYNSGLLHYYGNQSLPFLMFLVAVAAVAASLKWEADPFLANSIRVLGLMTYPLYLLHNNVGGVLLHIYLKLGMDRFAALAATTACCIAVSFLVVRYLEPPIRTALRNGIDWTLQAKVVLSKQLPPMP